MENGWIKLHRKFLKWEWSDNPKMVALFIHLLLSANHEDNKWHGITIKRGQVVIGRKSTNEITIKPTNRFSVVSILNWSKYQKFQPTNQPANQPTINQQITTNKNVKNDKNIKETCIQLKDWNERQKSPLKDFRPENIVGKYGVGKIEGLIKEYGGQNNGFNLFLTNLKP
jgi:hypothetical protein